MFTNCLKHSDTVIFLVGKVIVLFPKIGFETIIPSVVNVCSGPAGVGCCSRIYLATLTVGGKCNKNQNKSIKHSLFEPYLLAIKQHSP